MNELVKTELLKQHLWAQIYAAAFVIYRDHDAAELAANKALARFDNTFKELHDGRN